MWGRRESAQASTEGFFSPNNDSFLGEEIFMEFSHVASLSKVNVAWPLCLRGQCDSFC